MASLQMSQRFSASSGQSTVAVSKVEPEVPSPAKPPVLSKPNLSISTLPVVVPSTKESMTTRHGVSEEQLS